MTDSTEYWIKKYVGIEFGVIDEEQEDQEEDFTVIDRSIDEILKNLDKQIKPTDVVELLKHHFEEYSKYELRYMQKARHIDGVRARRHLLVLFHLCRARRMEILKHNKKLKWENKHKQAPKSVVDFID